MRDTHGTLELFSTCPPSWSIPRDAYLERVADVARWSDDAGYRGILVYTDNSLVDPWLLSRVVLDNTERLCPLVAVQPVYMHPYAVAKMIATLAYLHERRVFLNLVAGGFVGDLHALGDDTEHDDRYERIVEYTQILMALIDGLRPLTVDGRFYRTDNLKLEPRVPEELRPGLLISGSSDAGLRAARAIGATAIRYPKPPGDEEDRRGDTIRSGVRVGVIARSSAHDAWTVALDRFPEDRKGQITHALAMSVSDSRWHRQLSDLGERPASAANPYWLGPFQNYKTFCPYLVGSYEEVGDELARYIALGYETFIMDVPASAEELEHIAVAFAAAQDRASQLDTHAEEDVPGEGAILSSA